MASVYLETGFFSECVTMRLGPVDQGRRITRLNWWNKQAKDFQVFISPEVIRELSAPDFPEPARTSALAILPGLRALEINAETSALAELFVRERVMPAPPTQGDAIHLGAAVIHRMDYLLTWNQQHLANPNKRVHLAVICAQLNLLAPQIVTPDLLITEADNV